MMSLSFCEFLWKVWIKNEDIRVNICFENIVNPILLFVLVVFCSMYVYIILICLKITFLYCNHEVS